MVYRACLLFLPIAAWFLPGTAFAQTTVWVDSVLVLGRSYAQVSVELFLWEHWTSPLDSASANLYGFVDEFGPPLTDVPLVGHEATFAVTGLQLVDVSHWDGTDGESGGLIYGFDQGTFTVYLDDSPDADWANPVTFQDGEALLQASVSDFWFSNCECYHVPTTNGGYVDFTGGSRFEAVSRDGAGFRGLLMNYLDRTQVFFSPDSVYQFPARGSMALWTRVPVRPATWGSIKHRFGRERF